MSKSIFLFSLFVVATACNKKQSSESKSQQLSPLIGQLHSNDLAQRMDAFYSIVSLGAPKGSNPLSLIDTSIPTLARANPALPTALIDTLNTENTYIRKASKPGEDFSNYYGDVLVAVTDLHDPRAIGGLVDAMDSGNVAMNALADFGQPASGPVLDRLNHGVSARSACVVVGRMLDARRPRHIRDAATRKKIENSLLDTSRKSPSLVKISAYEALAKSDDVTLRNTAIEGIETLAQRTDNGIVSAAALHSLRYLGSATDENAQDVQKLAATALSSVGRDPAAATRRPSAKTSLKRVLAAAVGIELPPPVTPQRIKVGGSVQAAKLISEPKPIYPPLAKSAGVEGEVTFTAAISKEGTIQNLQLVSGNQMLVPAARDAVRRWVFRPTLLNGEPVEVLTTIKVVFKLQ